MIKLKPLKVSDLNMYIKNILSRDPILTNVVVEGEVSNLKFHSSGHVYLTLKDEKSKLNAVMFNGNVKVSKLDLKEGSKVKANGYISVFERDGSYQLYIKDIEPIGEGDLFFAYERLKAELAEKGYFDAKNKLKLPAYPQTIGLVTSPTGAAVKDMISVIQRRMPGVEILISPVLVQGPDAPADIVRGLEKIDSIDRVDLVIVGRGGGSIEELWAFNERIVAEAIFKMKKPIISAVGHETDFTIADFVADLRAPTPSAAAELAVMEKSNLQMYLNQLYKKMNLGVGRYIEKEKNSLLDKSPEGLSKSLIQQIVYQKKHLEQERLLLDYKIMNLIKNQRIAIDHQGQLLNTNNPLNVLEKGYAIVSKAEEQIMSAAELHDKDRVLLRFRDGNVQAEIIKEMG